MLNIRSKYKDPDDEYYTSEAVARLFLEDFLPLLRAEKRVVCPCDSQDSKIYLFLKENGVAVEQSEKMESVDYQTDNPVIVTNPPFSKIKEFLSLIRHNRFILITSHYTPHYAFFRPFNLAQWSKTYSINDWGRPSGLKRKSIQVKFITNIPNNFPLYSLPWIEPDESKDYDISCLDYNFDKQKWALLHTAWGDHSPNFNFRRKDKMIAFIEKFYASDYSGIDDGESFELKIKAILLSLDINHKYQPNGSQEFPDFEIEYNGRTISLECKTNRKSLVPMWNTGLPHKDMILLFLQTSKKIPIMTMGHNLIDFDRGEFKKWIKEKRDDLAVEFEEKFHSSKFKLYLREMLNQQDKLVDDPESVSSFLFKFGKPDQASKM